MIEAHTPNLTYLRCNKPGIHTDEYLNMVCLQTSCLQNLICCCACIESDHKKHITKPLKMVMNEARSRASIVKSNKFDIDVMLEIINANKIEAYELFNKYKQQITINLQNIELALHGYYNSTIQQIIIKNTDSNLVIEEAIERIISTNQIDELKLLLQKLVSIIPTKIEDTVGISQSDLVSSLKQANFNIQKSLSSNMKQVNGRLEEYQKNIQHLINNMNLWRPQGFKFSQISKHKDVKLINESTVKSVNNSSYKFAIMDNTIEKGNIRCYSFQIKQSTSNWLAIGMCHKKIVEAKNFGFSFGSIGHGGYMISTNGGSWSHSKSELNNSIKAFKYTKNDIIKITVNFDTKIMTFRKNLEHYDLPFQTIEQDKLYPCVLFYYINDEVEFLASKQ